MARTKTKGLTPKQQEVLDKLRAGAHPKEIAAEMGISPNGVYQHMKRINEAGEKYPTVTRGKAGRPKGTKKPGAKKPIKGLPTVETAPVERIGVVATEEPTLEDVLGIELASASIRLREIEVLAEELREENKSLTERIEKLKAAASALQS